MADTVIVFDTTLRDGEQSPGATMNTDQKIEVARQLSRLGVDIIEAGFPAASPGDLDAVRRIAKEVTGLTVLGLARTSFYDIDAAWEAVQHAEDASIHTFISTSPIHIERKLRKTPDEVIEMARAAVRRCKGYVSKVEFSAEDATRSDWDYLCQIFAAAIEEGATTINIPDTVGYTMPAEYQELIRYVQQNTPGIEDVVISVHCHNDLGMATANTLAAIQAGARQIEVTVNGIGERAGNTSLEEVVMALKTRHDLYDEIDTSIDATQLVPTSRLVSRMTGISVQPNKAIVGANAFAHEAGIHQDGMLKDRETYEIMTPESVGWEESKLVLGKHSGRAGFNAKLEELGYQVDRDTLQDLYTRFIELTDRKEDDQRRRHHRYRRRQPPTRDWRRHRQAPRVARGIRLRRGLRSGCHAGDQWPRARGYGPRQRAGRCALHSGRRARRRPAQTRAPPRRSCHIERRCARKCPHACARRR